MIRNMFATGAALLLALLFFASAPHSVQAEDPKCGLLRDCTFDLFYDPDGACTGFWKCDGGGIALKDSEGWPKGPSVWISSNAPLDRKIWQTVAVTPGKGYHFSLPFGVVAINGVGSHEGDTVNRRLGIDPFGGTDPNSGNIKWSGDFFGKGRFDDDQLQVSEYARADHITVFIWVNNPYSDKHVDVYIDTPNLSEATDMPPIQIAAPTPTAAPTQPPPTAKPTRVAEPTLEPTDAPQPTEPPAATAEPADEPTSEPTEAVQEPTAAPRATRTRVAQAQPTARPSRTRVAVAQSSGTRQEASSVGAGIELGMGAFVGLIGISGAILMVSVAAFLLLRRK